MRVTFFVFLITVGMMALSGRMRSNNLV